MCLWLFSIHCGREKEREDCVRERKVRFGGSGLAYVCGGRERKSFGFSEFKQK